MRHEIRIVPHKVPLTNRSTWYRVQVQSTIFRVCKFRVWFWRTIGDFPSLGDALLCRDNVRTCYRINEKESENNND